MDQAMDCGARMTARDLKERDIVTGNFSRTKAHAEVGLANGRPATDESLPPLPAPYRAQGSQLSSDGCDIVHCHLFCIEQMQAYARNAVARAAKKRMEAWQARTQGAPESQKPSAQGPAELWLQLHGDCAEIELDEPVDYTGDGVTWCGHRIHDSDVRYVRADLAGAEPLSIPQEPLGEPFQQVLVDNLENLHG